MTRFSLERNSETYTTVTRVSLGSVPWIPLKKVLARTTSKVVTPNNRLGSKTPAFLKTSAKMGTVELTGLEMTKTKALGADWAMAWARVVQIPALIYRIRKLSRSYTKHPQRPYVEQVISAARYK